MRKVEKGALRAGIWLFLCVLTPQLLRAQIAGFVDPYLDLKSYSAPAPMAVTVSSFARAVLYDSFNRRAYIQVIIGHGVKDITAETMIFQDGAASADGYANSRTGSLQAAYYHCYEASMVVHVNDWNFHHPFNVGPVCSEPTDPVDPDIPKENCPILLDLQQNGFHLSGPDSAVRFDIDADGIQDQIAWTKADGDDAFLCWDRNRNGVIDDGRELFGYATPLLSGHRAKIGYRALAELDKPERGGDGDGKVDSKDLDFQQLCAWTDANRDGVSQTAEIHALEDVDVVALEYRYKPTRLWDSFGNLFRYVSSARMRSHSGSVFSWPTYDVIFAEPSPNTRASGAP